MLHANWIGHVLLKNCLLKYVINGKSERNREGMRILGVKHKQLLDDVTGKEKVVEFESWKH